LKHRQGAVALERAVSFQERAPGFDSKIATLKGMVRDESPKDAAAGAAAQRGLPYETLPEDRRLRRRNTAVLLIRVLEYCRQGKG
jgi:hypothetical protein